MTGLNGICEMHLLDVDYHLQHGRISEYRYGIRLLCEQFAFHLSIKALAFFSICNKHFSGSQFRSPPSKWPKFEAHVTLLNQNGY